MIKAQTDDRVAFIIFFSRELRVSAIDWRNTDDCYLNELGARQERRIISATVACRLLATGIICFRPASIKQSICRFRHKKQQQGKSSLYIYSSAKSADAYVCPVEVCCLYCGTLFDRWYEPHFCCRDMCVCIVSFSFI